MAMPFFPDAMPFLRTSFIFASVKLMPCALLVLSGSRSIRGMSFSKCEKFVAFLFHEDKVCHFRETRERTPNYAYFRQNINVLIYLNVMEVS